WWLSVRGDRYEEGDQSGDDTCPIRVIQDRVSSRSGRYEMFKKLHFNIGFAEALAQMSKYAKMLKDLLTNKEKLLELANTPLNDNCSVVLFKRLPDKFGYPGKYLIPCDFNELENAWP
nr:reverse transcriptase domain-containing protein [Tanacetum cinerariifolium]